MKNKKKKKKGLIKLLLREVKEDFLLTGPEFVSHRFVCLWTWFSPQNFFFYLILCCSRVPDLSGVNLLTFCLTDPSLNRPLSIVCLFPNHPVPIHVLHHLQVLLYHSWCPDVLCVPRCLRFFFVVVLLFCFFLFKYITFWGVSVTEIRRHHLHIKRVYEVCLTEGMTFIDRAAFTTVLHCRCMYFQLY